MRDPSPQRRRAGSDASDSSGDGYAVGYDGTTEEEEDGGDEEAQDRVVEERQEEDGGLQAHWNLATYLPDAAAQYFHFVTGK